ncbi:Crp/Fnr family transcriptional regulator [Tropicibacter sp. Alg240-R139]|uniref:Crp/Fnr family transcriptional regulator n=1 Tax=Tropicibacter sp. Alg240-R139 TaxID=2305991 RepID=UPI0013DF6DB3|nr:Crp/Fnr family transcriptional regulator [Tropicibacter sp. Alg240-R139]
MNETQGTDATSACVRKLTPKQKKMMCRSGWLSSCPKTFQDALLNLGAVNLLQPGDVLYYRGKVPTHVHGLIGGQIDMCLLSQHNEELVYPATGSDKWYSFADVIAQEKAVGEAVAHRPTLMLSIPGSEFMAFLDAEPDRYHRIISHDNALRRHLQEVVTDLVTFDGVELVARRLLWMLNSGRIDPRYPFILSQHDLASSMGVSVPTVQRAFRQLKSEDIVTTEYGKFFVKDCEGLKAFLDNTLD